MAFTLVIGIMAAIAATVLLCIKVLPAKYDGTFAKKSMQKLHDYFNFKKLYLESILKTLFTFLTTVCVVGGVLAATVGNFLQFFVKVIECLEYSSRIRPWVWERLFTNFLGGIAVAIIAPIVLRLVYEGMMMFILLVKNVIEINNKIKAPEEKTEE